MTTSDVTRERESSHDLRDAHRLSSLQVHDQVHDRSRLAVLTFRMTEVLSEIDNIVSGG